MAVVVRVAPLIRLPRGLDIFDYLAPEEMTLAPAPGQIVRVPFRAQQVLGVVLSESNTQLPRGKTLKAIEAILTKSAILSERHLALAQWISQYCATALGIVLKAFLPALSSQFINTLSKAPTNPSPSSARENPRLILYPAHRDRFTQYQPVLQNALKNKTRQLLILVPELYMIEEWQEHLLNPLKLSHTVYTSELNTRQLQNAWQEISSGKTQIIIGTRLAAFAPFHNLGTILVDDEASHAHKQEEPNPRFHVRDVAQKMSELWGTELYFGSDSPSLEMWQKIHGTLTQSSNNQTPNPDSLFTIHDSHRGWPTTPALKTQITETLAQDKSVFLLINRLGSARALLCTDCGQEWKCALCASPLSYQASAKILRCLKCKTQESLPLTCPHCAGSQLKFRGLGSEGLEEEVKKIWPAYPVLRLDSSVTISRLRNHEIIKEATLIMGTPFALPYLKAMKLGLVGVLSLEQLLNPPDFRTEEQVYALLHRLHQSAPVAIQTFNPEHPFLQRLNQPYAQFAQSELQERQLFNWPPYCTLIKIIVPDKTQKQAFKRANAIFKKLQTHSSMLSFYIPHPAQPPYRRGRFRYCLILKAPADFDPAQNDLFSKIPSDCIIDVNPKSIF